MRAGKFLVLFGLFWSGMTLLFDGVTFVPITRQFISAHFPATEGTIVSSEVTEHGDSDGSTYGVRVSYTYTIDKHVYQGHRYRYQSFSSSDSAWARAAVAAHPPDSKVKVYYNPNSPEDSVLSPGVSGSDLFMLAFMTPFNAVMLGILASGLDQLRLRWLKPPAGGVKIVSSLRRTRVRLTTYSPLTITVAFTALTAFLSIFIVAFTMGGFHPSIQTMIVTWSLILSIGLAAGIWHTLKIFSGKYDLVIDELNSTLELPLTQKRKTRKRIPLSSIESIYVNTIEKLNSGRGGKTLTYAPTLGIKEGPSITPERLAEWMSFEKANAFASWLKEKLQMKDSDVTLDQAKL